ncbi:hypothetical protein MKJ04_10840 [Pontibacter sp. E15-1]|uniref:hypothetical protein n=1 Tax=Pontibacter sp. E15-1 TaxID=2919918 RepID=UPI001F4F89CC|nr:hypothetical protein [Pontibacter sp. E15-1]MCJ8165341.1 hypothetical protein [Pontibacter sp. E15-1]
MSQKLVRSMMVLFHVPMFLIILHMVWHMGNTPNTNLLIMPFQLISLALAGYLVLGDSSRDEYYPTLLALLVYDLVLYWYILH